MIPLADLGVLAGQEEEEFRRRETNAFSEMKKLQVREADEEKKHNFVEILRGKKDEGNFPPFCFVLFFLLLTSYLLLLLLFSSFRLFCSLLFPSSSSHYRFWLSSLFSFFFKKKIRQTMIRLWPGFETLWATRRNAIASSTRSSKTWWKSKNGKRKNSKKSEVS